MIARIAISPRDPAVYFRCNMPISRVTTGFVMIGGAIFLLLYVGLWDDPEAAIGIAWGSFVENLIALIALVLIGFGIRFAFYSKPCPVCDEKLRPTAPDCYQCGFNFETAPHWISRGSQQSYLLPKAKNFCAKSLQLIVYLFQLSVGFSMILFVNASILFGDVWTRVRQGRGASVIEKQAHPMPLPTKQPRPKADETR